MIRDTDAWAPLHSRPAADEGPRTPLRMNRLRLRNAAILDLEGVQRISPRTLVMASPRAPPETCGMLRNASLCTLKVWGTFHVPSPAVLRFAGYRRVSLSASVPLSHSSPAARETSRFLTLSRPRVLSFHIYCRLRQTGFAKRG